jgi:hypothetical protein
MLYSKLYHLQYCADYSVALTDCFDAQHARTLLPCAYCVMCCIVLAVFFCVPFRDRMPLLYALSRCVVAARASNIQASTVTACCVHRLVQPFFDLTAVCISDCVQYSTIQLVLHGVIT